MRVEVPHDRAYTPDHLWAMATDEGVLVGVTPYVGSFPEEGFALRLPPVGARLRAAALAGEIESHKSSFDLFSPCDGVIVAHNPIVVSRPRSCLEDPWGDGWLWRMGDASVVGLWSALRYQSHVEARR